MVSLHIVYSMILGECLTDKNCCLVAFTPSHLTCWFYVCVCNKLKYETLSFTWKYQYCFLKINIISIWLPNMILHIIHVDFINQPFSPAYFRLHRSQVLTYSLLWAPCSLHTLLTSFSVVSSTLNTLTFLVWWKCLNNLWKTVTGTLKLRCG